jgi:hypothetical protein
MWELRNRELRGWNRRGREKEGKTNCGKREKEQALADYERRNTH